MLIDRANLMLDLWRAELVFDAEIRSWAESEMMAIAHAQEIPTWLLDLVILGPGTVAEQGHDWRCASEFGQMFAVAATRVDPGDRASVVRFARWLARAWVEHEVNSPEAVLGCELEHFLSYHEDEDPAVKCVRERLPELLPRWRAVLRDMGGPFSTPSDSV